MDACAMRAMREELRKEAFLKELVALGAKDIPGTPRLLMKARDVASRAKLGLRAEQAYSRMSKPLMRGVEAVAKKVPEGVPKIIREKGRGLVEGIAKNPVGGLMQAVIPGGLVGVPAANKVLTKGMQLIDPMASRLMAQAV